MTTRSVLLYRRMSNIRTLLEDFINIWQVIDMTASVSSPLPSKDETNTTWPNVRRQCRRRRYLSLRATMAVDVKWLLLLLLTSLAGRLIKYESQNNRHNNMQSK